MTRLCSATILGACLIGQLVLVPAALGAWDPPKYEFGGFGGWTYFDEQRSLEGWNIGGRFAYFPYPVVGLEGQFTYSSANAPHQGDDQDFLWEQADLVFQVPMGRLIPFGKIGVGNVSARAKNAEDPYDKWHHRFTVDTGAGAKIWLNDHLAIRGDVNWYFTKNRDLVLLPPKPWGGGPGFDDRFTDYMAHFGAQIGFGGGKRDADDDGVPDEIDDCPATPAGVMVDARGCPLDSDGDGVPDFQDSCPDTPAGARVDARGCPLDSDGDGVYDGLDKCPGTLAGATVDATGCPLDADGDGIPDGVDQCPDTPAGARVDAQGCPLDADGDGVYDGIDKCPNTPTGVEIDEVGCPISQVLKGVNFELGSANLTAESLPILDEMAEVFKANPAIRFEIRGYADSTGSELTNLRLTQQRADSVKNYLVKKGVDPGRMVAKGYGEADPIASNDTPEGRAQNRRVEMHQLQ